MEMENPFRCPVCNTLMEEDKDAGFKIPPQCPYLNSTYPELCSLHDKLYFGKWRKMEAHPNDVKRAYGKLGQLLSLVSEVVRKENIPQAAQDVRKASDALSVANPEEEPYASVMHMDQALSYIHHAINGLLQEKRARLHSPADYEKHYDVVLPFKEDL
ncbi:MAG: hypothetical protein IH610_10760 [Deltaproteobacteria bacterium]|nr:hypothetical protein [Deltaproteobacteria bacterium]